MPQFAWQASWVAWLLLGGAGLAAAHALVSYLRARHVAPAGWLRVLLVLRLLTLASIAVAAFQPSIFLSQVAQRSAPVVILLDTSRSMDVVDTSRSTSSILRIAESLGRIEPIDADRPTRLLIARVQQFATKLGELRDVRAQLADSKTRGAIDAALQAQSRELLRQLQADTQSMLQTVAGESSLAFADGKLKQIAEQLDPPRKDQPERLIDSLLADLARRDSESDEAVVRSTMEVQEIVDRVSEQSRFELARQAAAILYRSASATNRPVLRTLDAAVDPDTLVDVNPDAVRTPLLGALRQSIERSGPREIGAIVVFTDGRSTEASRSIPPLLSAAGVPVYPVLCAPVERQMDVRVVSIDVPPTALVGQRIAATVHLRARDAGGRVVNVTLTDGTNPLTRTITLGSEASSVTFDLPAAAAPQMTLRASVDPIEGESLTDNNTATASVNVVDQKINVMLIAGNAAWDVQYLRNILSRTPWVVLQDQFVIGGEPCRFSPEQIVKQDVLVLAGVSMQSLSTQQIDAVHRAVSDQARSVMLMGMSPGLFASYSNQPLLSAFVPERIDQAVSWRSAPADEPTLRPVPAPLASELPMLRLDDAPDASLRRWLARPLMYRVLEIGRLKPQSAPLLIDRATGTPLIVESVAGSGRALAMLIDETWRWRRAEGGDSHDAFWLQLIRHLAEPPYNVRSDDLALGVDRTRVVAGESLQIRARTEGSTSGVPAILLRQGDRVVEQTPGASFLPGSGRWSATLRPPEAGAYQVVLQHAGRELSVEVTVLPDDQAEYADVSPDPGLLRRIANATGGKMFTLDQLDPLQRAIASPPGERVGTIEYALWCSPYLFAMVVAFLGLEWAIRKQIGLV